MSDNKEIDDIIKEIRSKNGGCDAPFNKENTDNTDTDSDKSVSQADFTISDTVSHEEEAVQYHLADDAQDMAFGSGDDFIPEYEESNFEETRKLDKKKRNTIIITAAAVILIVVLAVVIVAVSKGNSKDETTSQTKPSAVTSTTTEAPVVITNPLTGETGYNKAAVDVRPVACVVENSYYARPQWGIDSDTGAPDIILEGEVEGGESRMLWFYADYTSVPKQIGPMRSARPPFIKFSEMFDAIFIHWGQSSSKGNYVGAKTVFKQDNVDHINQMTTSGVSYLFGRDRSRNGYGTEHTGVLYGEKVAQAIKDCGFRTKADDKCYTKFAFHDKEKKMGETACNTLKLTFSSRSQARDWTYDAKDKLYHTGDFTSSTFGSSDVKRKNLLVLFDNTEYVVKANYKNSGRSETYCNYGLSGGKGKLASLGTVTDITWSVENGKLSVRDSAGKAVKLNVGTTWIGWGSANNGGSVKIG